MLLKMTTENLKIFSVTKTYQKISGVRYVQEIFERCSQVSDEMKGTISKAYSHS